MEFRDCSMCNEYRYIEDSGLCRSCYPIRSADWEMAVGSVSFDANNLEESVSKFKEEEEFTVWGLRPTGSKSVQSDNFNMSLYTSGSAIIRDDDVSSLEDTADKVEPYLSGFTEGLSVANTIFSVDVVDLEHSTMYRASENIDEFHYCDEILPTLHAEDCIIYINGTAIVQGADSVDDATDRLRSVYEQIEEYSDS